SFNPGPTPPCASVSSSTSDSSTSTSTLPDPQQRGQRRQGRRREAIVRHALTVVSIQYHGSPPWHPAVPQPEARGRAQAAVAALVIGRAAALVLAQTGKQSRLGPGDAAPRPAARRARTFLCPVFNSSASSPVGDDWRSSGTEPGLACRPVL